MTCPKGQAFVYRERLIFESPSPVTRVRRMKLLYRAVRKTGFRGETLGSAVYLALWENA